VTHIADHLKNVPLFTGMSERALEAIAGLASETTFGDSEVLTQQGDPGDSFLVILDGTVEIVRDGQPVRRLGAGDFIGEVSLVDGRARTATVTALGPVEALVITREAFQALMDRYAAVRLGVLMALTDRIRSDGVALID